MTTTVNEVLKEQGRYRVWFARQMGISLSYASLLLDGARRWTPELRTKAAQVLGVPEALLFASNPVQTPNDAHKCAEQEPV